MFNKVGDLYLKRGDVPSAVNQYEKAIDLYADQGFPNNAIALCNKVLRNAPGRTHVYLKLAKLMLQRGFIAESKQNLLEYAERMQKAGQVEEAFHALKEFADLSPDNEEIRLMLAEQLQRAARTDEAREQLAKLYQEVAESGDQRRARRTLDRIKAIDPKLDIDAPVAAKAESRKQKSTDIVFINLDDEPPVAEAEPEIEPASDADEPLQVETTPLVSADDSAATPAIGQDFSVERAGGDAPSASGAEDVSPLDGLEIATSFEVPSDSMPGALDIEPTALGEVSPGAFGATPEDEFPPVMESPDESLGRGLDDLPSLEGVDISATDEDEGGASGDYVDYIGEIPAAAFETPGSDIDEEVDLGRSSAADDGIPGGSGPWSAPGDLALEDEEDFESRGFGEAGVEVPELDVGDIPAVDDVAGWDEVEDGDQDRPVDPLAELPLLDADEPDIRGDIDDGEVVAVGEDEDEDLGDDLGMTLPVPSVGGADIPSLESLIAEDPDAPGPHRELGEALLEIGDRERGLQELDLALEAYEMRGDTRHAWDVADEILRLDPNSVHHHQKRVEFAYREGDKGRLARVYLELADALVRADGIEKAQVVYERVLDHDPDNARALSALAALGRAAPADEVVDELEAVEADVGVEDEDEGTSEETLPELPLEVTPTPPPAAPAARRSSGEFVDLGALILEDGDSIRDTRMRIEEEEPTGDEERDFREMLSEFKKGIDANIAIDDSQAHYDLGVAFKEMGLLDEAISEFQKALRGSDGRLRTAEALGLCFFEKGQYAVSATVLRRAIESEPGGDDAKIGLLYWLARCEEEQSHQAQALEYYQRIFSIDIDFHDVKERVKSLAQAGS